jgi:uncharacterized membrane protein
MSARSLLTWLLSAPEAPSWLPAWISGNPYITLLLITFLPYIELRGSIPVGIIGFGLDPLEVFAICTIANIIIILPIYIFLDFAFERVFRISWFNRHIEPKIDRIRETAEGNVKRYGFLGLAAFVAIPLPGTGAYSGCLASYLLGMERKKSFLSVALGVLVAGVLVTLASMGVFSALTALGLGWIAGLLVLVVIVILLVRALR